MHDYKIFTISITATDIDMWICQVLMIRLGKWFLFNNRVVTRCRSATMCLTKDNIYHRTWKECHCKIWVFGFKYKWCDGASAALGSMMMPLLEVLECSCSGRCDATPHNLTFTWPRSSAQMRYKCTTWSELSRLVELQWYYYFNPAQICLKFKTKENWCYEKTIWAAVLLILTNSPDC